MDGGGGTHSLDLRLPRREGRKHRYDSSYSVVNRFFSGCGGGGGLEGAVASFPAVFCRSFHLYFLLVYN